jgi:4-amino-4-deoxy-L-arabinose transferase-like glycosyltransferase
LTTQASTRAHVRIALLLLALTVATRLAFFVPGVINWDESTFILMAQEIVDGRLPYVTLWDLKPPLLFAILAGAIAAFGHDVAAVRLAGLLCVFIAALQIHLLASRRWDARTAWTAAVLFIIAASAVKDGQATMSEYVTLPFLLGATLVAGRPPTLARALAAGALLGVATLVRLNLAYVALGLGLWLAWTHRSLGIRRLAALLASYAIGGLAVLALTALPWALHGSLGLFVYSVFEAPLVYTQSFEGPLHIAGQLGRWAMGLDKPAGFSNRGMWIGLSIWLVAAVGLVACVRRDRAGSGTPATLSSAIGVATLLVSISIVMSGNPQSHYLIQLLPFACLYAAYAYGQVFTGITSKLARPLLAIAVIVMLAPTVQATAKAVRQLHAGQLDRGPAYRIAEFLGPRCGDSCSVYLLIDHLAYWLLDKQPPSRAVTHPSNITKAYLLRPEIGARATPAQEMAWILDQRPTYIVMRRDPWYLRGDASAEVLDRHLKDHYRQVWETNGRLVFERTTP